MSIDHDTRPASETILDSPQYWYRLAEEDQRSNPGLVAEYLRMAELMERYIELKLGKTWVTL
jgi:hypothetical protein